jgi:hypothetical protein
MLAAKTLAATDLMGVEPCHWASSLASDPEGPTEAGLPLPFFSLNFLNAGASAKTVRSRSVGSEAGGRRWSAFT